MRDALLVVSGFAILAVLAIIAYQNHYRFHRPQLTTSYQVVTLTNGSVFYGRIDHLGSDHPVLRDAFTVRPENEAGTGHRRYVLVRRKDELHGADHLIFPAASIAFVEPVQADSTIGRLIAGPGLRP